MKYKHTQIGYLIIYILIIVTVIFSIINIKTNQPLFANIFMVLVWLVLLSFTSLEVVINEKELKLKFGYGLFRKKFMLNEITSVKTVKNSFYYGWGIRMWYWPKMVIYNVSGFDAVEIKIKNGKIYRIGTDEPEKLKQAIQNSIL